MKRPWRQTKTSAEAQYLAVRWVKIAVIASWSVCGALQEAVRQPLLTVYARKTFSTKISKPTNVFHGKGYDKYRSHTQHLSEFRLVRA